MKVQLLQEILEAKAEENRSIIESNMPSRGLKECNCQQLCLLNRLNDFTYAVNGIEQSDMA